MRFIFIIILFTTYLHTQVTRVTREWGTYFGRTHPTTIIQTNDSIFIFGSSQTSGLPNDNNFINTRVSSSDYFLTLFSNENGLKNGRYINTSTTSYANMLFDEERNYYFFGSTSSTLSDLVNSDDNIFDGVSDFYFGKLNRNFDLEWSTLLGGTQGDYLTDGVVDKYGNFIVVGSTIGSTTGIANNGHQNSFAGVRDGIIAKYDNDGNQLWASYYGGSGQDEIFGVDVDDDGNIYFCGFTRSSSGIAFNGFDNSQYSISNFDAFLVKLDRNGNRIWGTYYGGDGTDLFNKIKINGNKIYLVGDTQSNDIIGENGFDNNYGGSRDGLITVFDTDGNFEWSSYIGGSGDDRIFSLDIDESGNIYIFGETNSTVNFTTQNSFQNAFGGGSEDCFFAKISSDIEVEFISYLGGSGNEVQPSTTHKGIYIDSLLLISFQTFSSDNIATNNGYFNTHSGAVSAVNAFNLEYSINLTQSIGGAVSADNSGYIQHGQSLKIKIETQQGYTLENVFYNSNTFGSISELNIDAVRNPVNVYAVWSVDPEGDIDGDGITNQEELDAPNEGDANNDGIKDYLQIGVTSLRDYFNEGYVTVSSNVGKLIYDAEAQFATESDYVYPFGQVAFKIDSSQTEIEIIYHSVSSLEGYEYRKQYADGKFRFHESVVFLIDTINDKQVAKVRLKLYDGGEGDFDQTLNGVIYDPGGPALPISANIPFWDWWWVFVLVPIIVYSYKKFS